MKNKNLINLISSITFIISLACCSTPKIFVRKEKENLPDFYSFQKDTSNKELISWKKYYTDSFLISLIDTALKNNQELNIISREIEINKNEISSKKGEYLPFGNIHFSTGADKSGNYTFNGMSEEDVKNKNNEFPRYIGDNLMLLNFSWEIDVWGKLHNAKQSAIKQYLASIEGKNFLTTELVAEIANSYYELLVLDNKLQIIEQNIAIQKDALEMIKIQKNAARVNQLAVNRFEAQMINSQNMIFEIKQNITETENKINYIVGRIPQHINRVKSDLKSLSLFPLLISTPSQLLSNRPDIRQAEKVLEANKLDVKVARANFYPSINLQSYIGIQSFNPIYLVNPKSTAFNLLGELISPLINRNSIKTMYYNAGEKQLQSVYKYEQTALNAYIEVYNQFAGIKNYSESFNIKKHQVDILNESIEISVNLFKSARADYTEVLLTQRELLEAKMEMIEIKQKQVISCINLYKALGGGWK